MDIALTSHYESHVAESLSGHNYLLSWGYVVGTTHGFMSVLIILGPQLRNAKSWALQIHHLVAGTNGVNDGGSFTQANINNQQWVSRMLTDWWTGYFPLPPTVLVCYGCHVGSMDEMTKCWQRATGGKDPRKICKLWLFDASISKHSGLWALAGG